MSKDCFYYWKKPMREWPECRDVGEAINLLDYVLVYIHKTDIEEVTEDALEDIFRMLDENRPKDYFSFSPCSGDVITFSLDKSVGYVVQTIGFKKVGIENVR